MGGAAKIVSPIANFLGSLALFPAARETACARSRTVAEAWLDFKTSSSGRVVTVFLTASITLELFAFEFCVAKFRVIFSLKGSILARIKLPPKLTSSGILERSPLTLYLPKKVEGFKIAETVSPPVR